jgi:hypothetical protein
MEAPVGIEMMGRDQASLNNVPLEELALEASAVSAVLGKLQLSVAR